jgi:sensor c-di-GMP phosphodiesterase-like protein
MASFVSVFITARNRRILTALVWCITFALILSLFSFYAVQHARRSLASEARESAQHFVRLRQNLIGTFETIHAQVTAAPCSPAFIEQLRQIAYLPDGLNEFMYAPGGIVRCSVNSADFGEGLDLGPADVPAQPNTGFSFWLDRDLSFVGLQGLTGSVALQGAFATIIPPQRVSLMFPDWMSVEVVLLDEAGNWWSRQGTPGVYQAGVAARATGFLGAFGQKVHHLDCDGQGLHCIAVEGDLAAMARAKSGWIALALLFAGLAASSMASLFARLVKNYWSFEQRFRRNLTADSIICAYQPVMCLETNRIAGCEVLARWRDVDDSVVAPDRFVDIVEANAMTLRFTEMVARRAHKELSAALPDGERIQVNFNIFPCDLASRKLLGVYAPFLAEPERFELVLEIVESDEIPANAQVEIEALRRAGIKTYIDDFGTGYSNMQSLAALSVDGVKLDRSFAMAPDNSMMARMLAHAVEMIHATGRAMVVEGVETQERLKFLQNMSARIDFVQGYLISRPLDIGAFATFLVNHNAKAIPTQASAA